MRIFTIVVILCVSVLTAHSQQSGKAAKYNSGKGISSYFVSVGGGTNVYVGDHDKWGIFNQRFGAAYDISIGKWIRPTWGVRLQYAGGVAKGVNSGLGPFTGSTPSATGIDGESFNVMNGHIDALLNLSTLLGGSKEGRNYEFVPFAGVAYASAWKGDVRNSQPAFTAGAINKFRLSDKLGLQVELKGLLLNDEFDGVVHGLSMEGLASLTAGLTYRFGKSTVKSKTTVTAIDYPAEEDTLDADKDLQIIEMGKELDNKNRLIKQLYKELDAERAKLHDSTSMATEKVEKTSLAIFFPIGATLLDGQDIINLGYLADKIKASSHQFTISGYADAGTGSSGRNKFLSDKRAQNVYNVLVDKYKVNPEQLEIVSKGGVDNMFESEEFNRVVLIENK